MVDFYLFHSAFYPGWRLSHLHIISEPGFEFRFPDIDGEFIVVWSAPDWIGRTEKDYRTDS